MYAKPIFRKPASRPHQYSVLQRRFRYGVFTEPPLGVEYTFVRRQLRNPAPLVDVRLRHRRRALGGVSPSVQPPGWMEAIRLRTERYPKLLAREQFDVRDALRARYVPTLGIPAPATKRRAIRKRLPLRVRERRHEVVRLRIVPTVAAPPPPSVSATIFRQPRLLLRRRWRQLQRAKFIPTKEAIVVAGADIGWLVVYMIKRVLGTHLRR